jgi:FAD/FMN-containing dehydrogenase
MDGFISQHPNIPTVLPTARDFDEARRVFLTIHSQSTIPLAVVKPRHADDVCKVVKYCTAQGIPFVVRGGGNNLFGKSQVHNALTIDMRGISYCRVDKSSNLATIGGGTLMQEMYASLGEAERATAVGMLGFIGWPGWAMYGGYGPLMANYGLGVQQIVGAKIVDANGEVLEADEALLKGIRGAGGSFGVVVELTITVYPLKTVCITLSTSFFTLLLRVR